MYEQGKEVEQNHTTAAEWYEKAAVNGKTDAQVNLGTMYHQGIGVEQSYRTALEWYE